MSNMRIAVAGTGGLAALLAHYINEGTSHNVVLLSRSSKPQLSARGFQVLVVDYEQPQTLLYALRGITTVVSTITGPHQIYLIAAAITAGVQRFAPAEFEGSWEQESPCSIEPPCSHRLAARQYLSQHASQIESTTFVCGILYERFQPGGLARANIATSPRRAPGRSGEGDYLVNLRTMSAVVPAYTPEGDPNVKICMTAARDVARFVTRALDLPQWPPELRMCGLRVSVRELLLLMQDALGHEFSIQWHSMETLHAARATETSDVMQARLRDLIDTAEGRFDYSDANLNTMFPYLPTIDFSTWLVDKWSAEPRSPEIRSIAGFGG